MSNLAVVGSRKRTSLEQWINDALNDTDKDKPCSQLTLVHKQGSGADSEIHTTKITASAPRAPKELAQMFWNKAETFAQDLAGAQTFNLLAFYGSDQPEARQPFLITPQTDTNGMATEGPDPKGQTQQGMRLTEQIVQGTMRERNILLQYLFQAMDRQAQTLERLADDNHILTEYVQKAAFEKVQLSHAQRMEEMEYERKTAERKKWLSYGPVLINSIMGKEVFPQNAADTALIEQIAENLPEGAIAQLSAIVPPELAGPLMNRFNQHMQKKLEEKRETDRLLGIAPSEEKSNG